MESVSHLSIKQILIMTFCAMSAYFIVNYGLVLYIINLGYAKKIAYSLSTTSIALYALANLFWGLVRPKLASLEQGLFLAIVLAPISYLCLMSDISKLQFIGIALYVATASLIVLSLTLFINQQANILTQRQKYNQWYQLILNAGSVLSTIGLALFASAHFKWLLVFSCLITFVNILILSMQGAFYKIVNKQLGYLSFIFVSLVLIVYILLTEERLTHSILMVGFSLAIFYAIALGIKAKEKSYFIYLILAAMVNTVYWLASTIYSTQFMVLLNSDVQSQVLGLTLSPLFIKMLDPLANIVFGLGIVYLYKKYTFSPFNMLITALISLALSFMILSRGIHLDIHLETIMLIWPLLACLFFAFAEFIISTNLRALIPTFIKRPDDQSFFMAFLRVSQAIGAVLAYYLTMHFSANSALSIVKIRVQESYLYIVMGVICLGALLTVILLKVMEKRWLRDTSLHSTKIFTGNPPLK